MQRNKKGLIHIIIICLFFMITSSANGQKTDELIVLTGLIVDSGLQIDEWTVTIKEKMPTTEAKQLLKSIGTTHNISKTETDELIKYQAVQIKEENDFTNTYELAISKNEPLVSDVSATIRGESWDDDIEAHYKEYSDKIRQKNFTENSRVYTCISTRDSDIINFVYIIEQITRKLDLENVSTQTDTINNSPHKQFIYGYTALWEEKIVVKTVPTNIQIVVESAENGKENMIIGTPILINEY